ncbi:MAG TPA: hypothetical protein PLD55_13340 [bacterium]|nr:hypothetical protein [bacterium]HOG43907.1 hypothetical protein [bacterium]HQM85658.1 hypothetical protein [bacterium]
MSIRLSKKHGLNPSVSVCFFCGKEKNELVIPGRLKGDAEAPRKAVWSYEPCDECKKYMSEGVMVCVVKDGSDPENPFRTGRLLVIRDEDAKRIFNVDPEKTRFFFLEESAVEMVFSSKVTA